MQSLMESATISLKVNHEYSLFCARVGENNVVILVLITMHKLLLAEIIAMEIVIIGYFFMTTQSSAPVMHSRF